MKVINNSLVVLACVFGLFLFATAGYSQTHTITANAGAGGTISPSGAVPVADGADQNFIIAPDPDYDVLDVYVDSVPQGPLYSYDFLTVTADHTITAAFDCFDPVRLDWDNTYYGFVMEAYDHAVANFVDNFTIQLVAGTMAAEDLLFDADVLVRLEGGYDCSFLTNSQVTAIPGSVTITAGTLIPSNIGLSGPPPCLPGDPNNFPGNPEICDGLDNNCNGLIDDGLTFDDDDDGSTAIGSCGGSADDCNDNDRSINPGALEICDGQDNNCDGQIDEGLSAVDVDGDTYTAIGSCGSADDCNDNDAGINPGATEILGDGIDQDCDDQDLIFPVDSDCFDCHDVNFVNNLVHNKTAAPDSSCINCHAELVNALLPEHYGRTVKTADNNMAAGDIIGCTSCHDWHDPAEYDIGGANFVWAKVTAAGYDNLTCDTCHGIHFLEHSHHSGAENDVSYNPAIDTSQALQLGCAACHHDYDTVNSTSLGLSTWETILVEHDLDGTKDGSTNTCNTCHAYDGSSSAPLAAVQGAISSGNPATCATCHTDKVPDVDHAHDTGEAGTGCESCHGHDPGYEYEPGEFSQGNGSFQSHSTHTESDVDDLKGPFLACAGCHDTNNFPFFTSGIDSNGDGKFNLAETTVCDNCHSPGGVLNGVDSTGGSVGAKDNWATGVYAGKVLATGKERWCDACHDDAPANSKADNTGVSARDVIGDNATYGYYQTGHGRNAAIDCLLCHSSQKQHIDDNYTSLRTVIGSGGNPTNYRLYDGKGMRFPYVTGHGSAAYSTNELCWSCHDYDTLYNQTSVPADATTNFREDSPNGYGGTSYPNLHRYHEEFAMCVYCHDPHGRNDRESPKMTRGEWFGNFVFTKFDSTEGKYYELADPDLWNSPIHNNGGANNSGPGQCLTSTCHGGYDFSDGITPAIAGSWMSIYSRLYNPQTYPVVSDQDGDNIHDTVDNCINAANPGQLDGDEDLWGDACDNCPLIANLDQVDSDYDNIGDVCDMCPDYYLNDVDGDGHCGNVDNCSNISNPDQADDDNDGAGNVCDLCPGSNDTLDADGDGVPDGCDICPAGNDNTDTDSDGVPDACDICLAGDDAVDTDNDGVPDACDLCPGYDDAVNSDSDGVPDDCDNCPADDNLDQSDLDSDSQGDVCDLCPLDSDNDIDNDTVCGDGDNCPVDFNPLQEDNDGDGVGNACDPTPDFNAAPTLTISLPNGETFPVGQRFNITYSLSDIDDVVTTAFYWDTDDAGLDGTAITGACASAPEGENITCFWDTNDLIVGNTYYVYGITDDGHTGEVSAYSGPLTFIPYCTGTHLTDIPFANSSEPGIDGLTAETAFTICTLEQLNEVRNQLDKHFVLRADIDASDTSSGAGTKVWNGYGGWLPIGSSAAAPFIGEFDGKGYTIANLYSNRTTYVGLFGTLYSSSTSAGSLKNIRLSDVDIHGITSVGALAGNGSYATIINSYAQGNVTARDGSSSVGGLVGLASHGTIYNSYADVNVGGTSWELSANFGGLVGNGQYANISYCAASGNVSGTRPKAGGLVGYGSHITITNSFATGDVTVSASPTLADSDVGGLVGGGGYMTISSSYATGDVTGTEDVGGFVGFDISSTITNSYATGNVTGSSAVVGGFEGYPWGTSINNSFSVGDVTGDTTYNDTVGAFIGFTSISGNNLFYNSDAVVTNLGTGSIRDQSSFATGDTVFNLQDTITPHAVYNTWDFTTDWQGRVNDFPILRIDNDGDGFYIILDNCPGIANPSQTDSDGDGIGDICDVCALDPDNDIDGDGICGDIDPCPLDNPDDSDSDGICTNDDNCPDTANTFQDDSDIDGIGDICDILPNDFDNDYVDDAVDNCPLIPNPGQEDYNTDGVGDACDPASPGYGIPTLSFSAPNGDTAQLGSFMITYTLIDVDDDVTADFYLDTDSTGLDGTPLAGDCAVVNEGVQVTCAWPTIDLVAGTTYYIYGIVNDGVNGDVSAYSGSITFEAEYCIDGHLTNAPFANSGETGIDGLTAETAFSVCTLAQLHQIRNHRDKYFILQTDMDASDTAAGTGTKAWNSSSGWVPIGSSTSNSFIGVFDGNGHTISNLYINRPTTSYVGLFGYLYQTASPAVIAGTINNLGLVDVDVRGYFATGSLGGWAYRATITNSYVTGGTVTGTHTYSDNRVGGLVGIIDYGTLSNSYSDVTVTATNNNNNSYAGGLAGDASSATVDNCYATGDVTGNQSGVGGLFGMAYGATIRNSYATGDVTGGGSLIGGFVGRPQDGTITNCYATGNVVGNSNDVGSYNSYDIGSFVGSGYRTTIQNSFGAGNVTGNTSLDNRVGAFTGYNPQSSSNLFYNSGASVVNNDVGSILHQSPFATGDTVSNLQDTTTPHTVYSTWDFTTIWQENPGGFPTLR